MSTTSGVLLQNLIGDKFVTAASDAISNTGEIYQQYTPNEFTEIGKAVDEISFTDVAIVQLSDGVTFENETFETEDGGAPTFTRLFGESEDVFQFSQVYLNSPFTGYGDGVGAATSIKIENTPSVHPEEDGLRFIAYEWFFTGQVEGEGPGIRPPDGPVDLLSGMTMALLEDFFGIKLLEGL
jgi:hypothetical protein